jgi:alkylation response protein AidB-like acyl-CoA dehydrogenase
MMRLAAYDRQTKLFYQSEVNSMATKTEEKSKAAKLFKGAEYLISQATKDNIFTPEDFTDEQKQIGETTAQFVLNEVVPRRAEIENHDFGLVVQLMKKCGELGLLMIDAPEEYGGLELDKATSMLAAEKISAAGSFSVTYSAHSGIGTLPLVYYGTREQKEKYLEKIISGEWIAAYCLTEPDSGSDALGAKATATLSADGKFYLLNGTKQFITNGSIANLYTIFAKIDKEHFTAFLVERTTEGLSVGPEENKLGIRGSSTTQVVLENAKVPVENVLGQIGKGHKIAFNVLNVGRFKLGAGVTGAAKYALTEGIKYANVRKQFGVPIASFGAIKEKIADLTAATFAAESLVYRLAGLLDNKLATIDKNIPNYYEVYQKGIEEYAIECAIAKVFCSEVLAEVVDEVVQIHGGYGFIQEYPAEGFYRDERINRIFEGTNEINRLLIPGTILTRAMKGEIPLQREAAKAFESLMSPSMDELDDTDPFAAEKELVANLKKIFLVLAGSSVQKFMMSIKDEQETLLAAADVAINIFAIESALLRAEKILPSLSEAKRASVTAAVKVFTFNATEQTATAARKAAFFIEEGDALTILLSGIRRFTKYDATGLLKFKRHLAASAIEAEKYIF